MSLGGPCSECLLIDCDACAGVTGRLQALSQDHAQRVTFGMVTAVPACTTSASGAVNVKVANSFLKPWLSQEKKKSWAFTDGPADRSPGSFTERFPEGEPLRPAAGCSATPRILPPIQVPDPVCVTSEMTDWSQYVQVDKGSQLGSRRICLLGKPVAGPCTGNPDLKLRETCNSELRLILLEKS